MSVLFWISATIALGICLGKLLHNIGDSPVVAYEDPEDLNFLETNSRRSQMHSDHFMMQNQLAMQQQSHLAQRQMLQTSLGNPMITYTGHLGNINLAEVLKGQQMVQARKNTFTVSKEILDKWFGYTLETTTKYKQAEELVKKMYAGVSPNEPKIIWVRSPMVFKKMLDSNSMNLFLGAQLSIVLASDIMLYDPVQYRNTWRELLESSFKNFKNTFTNSVTMFNYYSSFAAIESTEGPESIERYRLLVDLLQSCGGIYPYTEVCFLFDKPSICKADDRHRLHSTKGPALAWKDGSEFFFLKGLSVDSKYVKDPDKLKKQEILTEANVEIRRVVMEMLGSENFAKKIGAELMNTDKVGKLYKVERIDYKEMTESWRWKNLSKEERNKLRYQYAFAVVKNSTAEPDGSFKEYWISCDPVAQSCQEAIGRSFFGSDWKKYKPEIET